MASGKQKEVIKVGIIGCGEVARGAHIPAFLAIDSVRIVAVCDKLPEVAKKVASPIGANYYSDASAMFETEKIDIMDICTPPDSHAYFASEAIAHGCHVLIEKPFTLTTKEADKVVLASDKAGVKLCVVHSNLFWSGMERARIIVQKGEIGEPLGIVVKHYASKHEARMHKEDCFERSLPGGVLGEMLPHPIYMTHAFIGATHPVALYCSKTNKQTWLPIDNLVVVLGNGNQLSTISMSCNSERPLMTLDILGSKANLHITPYYVIKYFGWLRDQPLELGIQNLGHAWQIVRDTAIIGGKFILRKYETPHARAIRRFIESIQLNTAVPVSVEQARDTVAIWEEIIQRLGLEQ